MALGNVHLTPQLVQAVRDAADVVEIAGEHTRLKKAGKRYAGLCPLHKEKTPSFSVDPAQGLFYCFGCGSGGDAIKLHMLLSGDDFPAAIESLAQRYGIPLPSRPVRRSGGREEPDLEAVLEAAAEFFSDRLKKTAGPRAYLEKRKIDPELIDRFRLGYAPDGWRNLVGSLHPKIPLGELEAAGLVARSDKRPGEPYDRFRHRLMFPIRAASGRLVGFGGRALGEDAVKYLNTRETSQFRKGSLLYGLDQARRAIRDGGRALLVEGYFDVLGALSAGIDWTVASMGTALTPEQGRMLGRYAEEVVVGYDGDVAGEEAYRRTLPLLLARGLAVRRLEMGEGQDPDSMRLEQGDEALVEAIEGAPDGVSRELERLTPSSVHHDPQLRARAARAVAELLGPIGDQVLRFTYGRRAADRLGVPVDVFMRTPPGGAAARPIEEESEKGKRIVSSVEERVLQLLLSAAAAVPPLEELPPEEVFLDPACRNIYRLFYDLYRDGEGRRPEPQAVTAALTADSEAVDRIARLLLEDAVPSSEEELGESFWQLTRRWYQQRLRLLSAQIDEAQRAGDGRRLENLIEEKTELSRLLHRRTEGGSAD